jgi:hypothetical protein
METINEGDNQATNQWAHRSRQNKLPAWPIDPGLGSMSSPFLNGRNSADVATFGWARAPELKLVEE